MGLMEVNGIRVFAYHGCLEEEGRIGGHFRVDIAVEGDLDRAETSDRLEHAVDYGRVEHVARRILDALKAEWDPALHWHVRLVKERPPINGDVAEAVYSVEG